ncbi:glycine--tRNA ligase subunit beta [Kordiimonas marina]|uniref:glycine--tRNA ligase subunit beta n=1 Tax=Kordiimonas marina TaxID=2872312 RepID=UPI001FF39FD8|nr:glycine--tRNA ligase subunit beta [Kordiimonas marina]MCJ9427616.1 glycine--tRNA ligase subunit beta [Kordiimonas marina]
MADLLIELFSEEIPARMQKKASDDLKAAMTGALKDAGLTFESADTYATPRRLALHVAGVPTAQPDVKEERRGPRADAPEKAIEGFLRGAGVTRAECEEREDPKGTFLYAIIEKKGRSSAEVIAESLEQIIRSFPWPKAQRWGKGSLKWVRPLHSILCLFDGAVVPVNVDGIKAGSKTFGHRFMAPEWFDVTDLGDYEAKLLAHKVVLDPSERAALIEKRVCDLAAEKGLEWVEDRGLLAEVAGLVEWPVPLMGNFDPAFMEVPEEVLILTMKKDQKYFVTRDPNTGKLAPHFITVANMEPSDGGVAVGQGNERVLTARLSDAKFFWEQDLKVKLDDRLDDLKDIVFHADLGTVAGRADRMKKLAGYLAQFIPGCDNGEAERAAELAKADLVSGMVFEFPEVQGVMGRYYAQKQGESAAVADAIRDHYAPQGPNDDCPTAPVSVAVALAEKLDTLVGFFGIGQKPTGSKDPYALRRAALGAIRLITENDVRFSLHEIFNAAAYFYASQKKASILTTATGSITDIVLVGDEIHVYKDGEVQRVVSEDAPGSYYWPQFEDYREVRNLLAFFADRLKVQQKDKGVRHDLIDAVFAKGDDDLVRVLNRVAALSDFLATDDGENLHAGYKRAANILKIEEKKDERSYDQPVDAAELVEAEEKALAAALTTAKAGAEKALAGEDFEGAMSQLSTLRAPIDAFFDKVTVNADEAALRANRLALLSDIRAAVNTVADFSLIEG